MIFLTFSNKLALLIKNIIIEWKLNLFITVLVDLNIDYNYKSAHKFIEHIHYKNIVLSKYNHKYLFSLL